MARIESAGAAFGPARRCAPSNPGPESQAAPRSGFCFAQPNCRSDRRLSQRVSKIAGFLRDILYRPPVRRPGEDSSQVQENPVKKILLAALLSTFAATAIAQDAKPTCKAQAAEKKLAGAALRSFLTKCKKDATATCQTDADEKKL